MSYCLVTIITKDLSAALVTKNSSNDRSPNLQIAIVSSPG